MGGSARDQIPRCITARSARVLGLLLSAVSQQEAGIACACEPCKVRNMSCLLSLRGMLTRARSCRMLPRHARHPAGGVPAASAACRSQDIPLSNRAARRALGSAMRVQCMQDLPGSLGPARKARGPWPTLPEPFVDWYSDTFPVLANRELMGRLAYTVFAIALARIGHFIPLPGRRTVSLSDSGGPCESDPSGYLDKSNTYARSALLLLSEIVWRWRGAWLKYRPRALCVANSTTGLAASSGVLMHHDDVDQRTVSSTNSRRRRR